MCPMLIKIATTMHHIMKTRTQTIFVFSPIIVYNAQCTVVICTCMKGHFLTLWMTTFSAISCALY